MTQRRLHELEGGSALVEQRREEALAAIDRYASARSLPPAGPVRALHRRRRARAVRPVRRVRGSGAGAHAADAPPGAGDRGAAGGRPPDHRRCGRRPPAPRRPGQPRAGAARQPLQGDDRARPAPPAAARPARTRRARRRSSRRSTSSSKERRLVRSGRKYPTLALPGAARAPRTRGSATGRGRRGPRTSSSSSTATASAWRASSAGSRTWSSSARRSPRSISSGPPRSRTLARIPGLGPVKIARFGEDILAVVRRYPREG